MSAPSLVDLVRPAPLSRYADIALTFVRSASFPVFLLYLLSVSVLPRLWKRHGPPALNLRGVLVTYNVIVAIVNVGCFVGFLFCLIRAHSIYGKDFDEELSRVYYVYWLTKVEREKSSLIVPSNYLQHLSVFPCADGGAAGHAVHAVAAPLPPDLLPARVPPLVHAAAVRPGLQPLLVARLRLPPHAQLAGPRLPVRLLRLRRPRHAAATEVEEGSHRNAGTLNTS